MTSSDKILVTGNFSIPSEFLSERVVHIQEPQSEQEIISNLAGVQHYIIGGPEYVDDHILSQAYDLQHVVVMGTQTSSFLDVGSAQSQGIEIENTPGINADAVAEFALGMVIVNSANSFLSYQNLLTGGWKQRPHKTLSEIKLGIVGMGNIGARLAKKMRALSPANISYFSRTRKEDLEIECNLEFKDLQSLIKESDALVICVTYKPETHHLINAQMLSSANKDLILLNFCHPTVVDPTALKDALESNRIKFAYIDGYYGEWNNNKGSQFDQYGLLNMGPEKFVATEHIAAQSDAVNEKILREAFGKISQWDENNRKLPSRENRGTATVLSLPVDSVIDPH